MGVKVGIDLGTTFSAVAIIDENSRKPVIVQNSEGSRITPSVIQFTETGEIVVGSEAKEAFEAGEDGCVSVFKRNMGKGGSYCSFYGKEYTAEELSAILLTYLKEEAETELGENIEEAVITVPAYFYHKERKATLEAAKMAKINVRQLINEPTATAMTYGVNHWRENSRILVYDLGGGTFDVTVVQMKSGNHIISLQTLGDHSLGGKDWDARITGLIEEKIGEATGIYANENIELHRTAQQISESIKKQLSKADVANFSCQISGYGRYGDTITIEEFNSTTRDLIEKTGMICNSVLEKIDATWNDITDILLVGGSTRMRQVSEYLQQISGHMPLSHVNPDEAVALGAAIQVNLPKPEYTVLTTEKTDEESSGFGKLSFRKNHNDQSDNKQNYFIPESIGEEKAISNALTIRNSDVVAHAMGIIAVNQEGTHYINKTIIPANQQIPVKCAKSFHFYTSARKKNEVEVYVLQGDKKPLESEIIGKYVISGIKHDEKENPTTLRIQYSYDMNGMVQVQARQGNDEIDLPISSEAIPDDINMFGRPIEKPKPEPLCVVMAVDVSGSMYGAPMSSALDAMCHFVDTISQYEGDVKIAVLAVSDTCRIVQNPTDNYKKCKSSIRTITCGMTGNANAGHPFREIQFLLKENDGKKMALVLADGMWDHQQHCIQKAKECHAMGIDIVGIGFGSADKQFLQDISSGDIDSMLVQQSELSMSFGKIAQEIGEKSNEKTKNNHRDEKAAITWLAIGE